VISACPGPDGSGQFIFVDIGDQPDHRKIGDPEQHGTRFDIGAAVDHFFQNRRRSWACSVRAFLNFTAFSSASICFVLISQNLQPPARGVDQQVAAGGDLRKGTLLPAACAQRQQVFLLGGDQFGAVDRQQRLSFDHEAAGEIGKKLFHPAADLGRNGADPLSSYSMRPTVRMIISRGRVFHFAELDADHLLPFGRYLHTSRGQLPAVCLPVEGFPHPGLSSSKSDCASSRDLRRGLRCRGMSGMGIGGPGRGPASQPPAGRSGDESTR
jgi:hypothetical protein